MKKTIASAVLLTLLAVGCGADKSAGDKDSALLSSQSSAEPISAAEENTAADNSADESFESVFSKAVDDVIAGGNKEEAAERLKEVSPAALHYSDIIDGRLASVCDRYNDGSISEETAEAVFAAAAEGLGELYIQERYSGFEALKQSKQSYINAVNARNNGDYKTAAAEIAKVTDSDTNYAAAKEFSESLYAELREYLDTNMESYMNSGDYAAARQLYNDYKEYRPLISFNDEYTVMLETMTDEQIKNAVELKKQHSAGVARVQNELEKIKNGEAPDMSVINRALERANEMGIAEAGIFDGMSDEEKLEIMEGIIKNR